MCNAARFLVRRLRVEWSAVSDESSPWLLMSVQMVLFGYGCQACPRTD